MKPRTGAIILSVLIHVAIFSYIAFLAFSREIVLKKPIDLTIQTVEFEQPKPPPPPPPPIEHVKPREVTNPVESSVAPIPIPPVPSEGTNPQPVSKPAPKYPSRALEREKEGTATVMVSIDTSGNVISVTLVSEEPSGWGFGDSAMNAVRRYKYRPYAGTRNNIRVVVRYRIQ